MVVVCLTVSPVVLGIGFSHPTGRTVPTSLQCVLSAVGSGGDALFVVLLLPCGCACVTVDSGRAFQGIQAPRVLAEGGLRGGQREHLQERGRGGSHEGTL